MGSFSHALSVTGSGIGDNGHDAGCVDRNTGISRRDTRFRGVERGIGGLAMDVLSDTLRVVRLSGAVFLRIGLATPWLVDSEPPQLIAQYFNLPSDCLALFHVLTRGECWFHVPGYAPVELHAGDAILMPHGESHTVSSEASSALTPTPMRAIMPPLPLDDLEMIERVNPGAPTQFLCGYLHCDQRFNPLIGALPPLIVVRRKVAGEVAGEAPSAEPQPLAAGRGGRAGLTAPVLPVALGDWLGATLDRMIEEAQAERPGGSDMLSRLSELLFVEIVRRYMGSLSPVESGWLAGVRDPIVGKTLRLLHERPARDWTVTELADAAAVARSTLAQRFTTLIGETPMRYLASWRIQLAKRLLRETDLRLADIATRVGYESEVAFNRAFKRHVGWPPATWRAASERERQTSETQQSASAG